MVVHALHPNYYCPREIRFFYPKKNCFLSENTAFDSSRATGKSSRNIIIIATLCSAMIFKNKEFAWVKLRGNLFYISIDILIDDDAPHSVKIHAHRMKHLCDFDRVEHVFVDLNIYRNIIIFLQRFIWLYDCYDLKFQKV